MIVTKLESSLSFVCREKRIFNPEITNVANMEEGGKE